MWNPFSKILWPFKKIGEGIHQLLNLYKLGKLSKLIDKFIKHPEVIKDVKFWKDFINTLFSIKEIQVMLQGYKTYIVAALMAIATFLHALGIIDDATYQAILAFLGSLGVATIAAKVNRITTEINNKVNVAPK